MLGWPEQPGVCMPIVHSRRVFESDFLVRFDQSLGSSRTGHEADFLQCNYAVDLLDDKLRLALHSDPTNSCL